MRTKLNFIRKLIKHNYIKINGIDENCSDEEIAASIGISLDILKVLNGRSYAGILLSPRFIDDLKAAFSNIQINEADLMRYSLWSYLFMIKYNKEYSQEIVKMQLKFLNELDSVEDYDVYEELCDTFETINDFADVFFCDQIEDLYIHSYEELEDLREKIHFVKSGKKYEEEINECLKVNFKKYFSKQKNVGDTELELKYLPNLESIYKVSTLLRCCLYNCFEPDFDDEYEDDYPLFISSEEDFETSFVIWCRRKRIVRVYTFMEFPLTNKQKQYIREFANKNKYIFDKDEIDK